MDKNWYRNGLEVHQNEGQKYSWVQTPFDVTVTLDLDPPLKNAKDLIVDLTTTTLKVRRVGMPDGEYLIDGTFTKAHRLDDSNWWIDDKKQFNVLLQKIKRSEWWMSVFVGHKELTWEQIQPEHPTYAEDLDGESQALVKKMMFDNQQRQRGLPTSDEMDKFKMLEDMQKQNPNIDINAIMAAAQAAKK